MKLITLSGLDGSGKSTQIKLLRQQLLKENKRVFYFHAVSFSIANRILGANSKPGKNKAITTASSSKIFLRKIALIIDCWRFRRLKQKLDKEYDYLLSDRYFYDQIVNILYLENKAGQIPRSAWWQKIAKRLIIKPTAAIYLQVPPAEINKRSRAIEQGMEYLKKKNFLYQQLASQFKLQTIDGNKNKEQVFKNFRRFHEQTH